MEDLMNLIRREFDLLWKSHHKPPRSATVTSWDPKTHSFKAIIQPTGQETGWIPVMTHHVGNGFGIVVGLTEGDQVELDGQENDIESLRLKGRVHSDQEKPPQVQSGEMLLQHACGHSWLFDKNKNVTFTHGVSGGTHQWDPQGNHTWDMKNKAYTVKNAPTISFNPGT